MQNAPIGAFCNTFDLHSAIIGLVNQYLLFFLIGPLRQVLLYPFYRVILKKMRSRIPDREPVHRKLAKECKGRSQQLRKRQGCSRWKPDGWFQAELRPNIFWVLYQQQTHWWVWIMHPSKSREGLKEPKGLFIISLVKVFRIIPEFRILRLSESQPQNAEFNIL